jgi:hypothetical protein
MSRKTIYAICAMVILVVAIAISIMLHRGWAWLLGGIVAGGIVALWP